jgi:four helix bundle protein
LAFQKLDIYVVARSLMCSAVAAKIRDAEFRDQATRASKSVFLAIAEGLPSPRNKVRKVYFERARGSLTGTAAEIMRLANPLEPMLIAMTR